MDVKGAGWVAAFPAPNVTVTSQELSSAVDYLAEELENRADDRPSEFDFLGRDIDSGFRVARHSSSDRFVASVELAWLLSQANRDRLVGCTFAYHGRHILKGVLKDRPYPIISIDTERSPTRRDVRNYEQALQPHEPLNANKIRDFCKAFMEDELIEFPALCHHDEDPTSVSLPGSYLKFQRSAASTLEENAKRGQREREAGDAPEGDGGDIPAEVMAQADAQVQETAEAASAASNPPRDG